MSKKATQSANWNFTVVQRQIPSPIAGRGPIPYFGNFREDTGDCLGITSEQYGIIQNGALLDAARAALDQRGMSGYAEKILVAGEFGQRFYAEFTFADKQLASDVGDLFGYKLTLRNSFDRTLRAAFSLGFLRLICKNGASTMEKEFSVTRKHSSRVTVDFVGDAIDHALAQGREALSVFDTMAKAAISDEQGANVLDHLVLSDVLSGSLSEAIKTLWLNPRRQEDKARNLYNLYNAATEHLTHQVSGDRFEYAEKVSNTVLLRFANAARHPDKLAKLVLPVPAEAVAVRVDAGAVAEATQAPVIDVEVVPA